MKNKLYRLFSISLLGFIISFIYLTSSLAQPGTESPGFHGMLVIGTENIYISHLPMFTPKHRYQGIWEVTFGEEADRKYRDERGAVENSGVVFTLAPQETFRLPELVEMQKEFIADVYVGHFERPGHRKLLQNTKVTLKKTIHWHPFLSHHSRPEALTYFSFGEGDELFLAHWITEAPNYDQVLVINLPESSKGVPLGSQFVVPGRSDDRELKVGEEVPGLMILPQGPERPVEVKIIEVKIKAVFYLEKGELEKNSLPDES